MTSRQWLLLAGIGLLLGACAPQAGRHPGPFSGADAPLGGEPIPPDATTAANPGGLAGLPVKDVLTRLGEPTFRRHEAPAEIWQYSGPGCVLDLFIYNKDGTLRVTHAELRSRALAPAEQNECLKQLLAGTRGDPNS